MTQEVPLGGNLNDAVRVGDTVRRTAGPWTPAVHALLRFLEARDFPAPRVLGMDDRGREMLRYVEGEAHNGTFAPLPDHVMDERHVAEAARLLRRYHDLVAEFRPPPGAAWRLVSPTEPQVICHNDCTPWNALFQQGKLAMMLDWDLAGPGSRVWGVASSAAAWAPLYSGHRTHTLDQVARRLRLFVDAYGLEERGTLLDTARLYFVHVGRWVDDEARRGDAGMRRLVAMGVPEGMFVRNVDWLDRHRGTLEAAL